MDAAGVDISVVFACPFNGCTNNWLRKEIQGHTDRLKMVATLNPLETFPLDRGQLRDLLRSGECVGLKFYLGYEHFYPTHERLKPYYDILSEFQRPAIFHTGDCYSEVGGARLKYAHPLAIDDVACDYPDMRIIIAHMGNPWIREASLICAKNPHVYADVSGYVDGRFTLERYKAFIRRLEEWCDISDRQGVSKLIFGSDAPICNLADYVNTMRGLLSEDKHQQLFSDTARMLFGI